MDYSVGTDSHQQLLDRGQMPADHELNNLSDGVQSDHGSKNAAQNSRFGASTKMWNPIWLHRMILIGFAAVFASLFVTTIVLFHFSEILHGLGTQVSTNHYSWTYGPTACESFTDSSKSKLRLNRSSARYNLSALAPS